MRISLMPQWVGPYDYASTMHYQGIGTIPPGMPVPSDRLSAGDIDGVARFVWNASCRDHDLHESSRLGSPRRWRARRDSRAFRVESRHDASAASVVPADHRWPRGFVFRALETTKAAVSAPWTAGPESTWFEAKLHRSAENASLRRPARGRGTVTVRPESRDGYLVSGEPIEFEANVAPGSSREFLHWSPAPRLSRGADRSSKTVPRLGPSGKILPQAPTYSWSRWSSHGSPLSESRPRSTARSPLYLVDSNVDGIEILVDGESKRIPWAFPTDALPNGVTVEAPLTVPDASDEDADLRGHDVR